MPTSTTRSSRGRSDPSRLVLLAPVIFVLHVVEEAPRFVAWFNAIVSPPINQRMFLSVNVVVLIVTVMLAVITFTTREAAAAVMTIAWLSFMMLANALFHVVGSIVHGYSPGTITSALLYLPFFFWFLVSAVRWFRLNAGAMAVVVLAASAPMAVHGYLIVFEGGRLF